MNKKQIKEITGQLITFADRIEKIEKILQENKQKLCDHDFKFSRTEKVKIIHGVSKKFIINICTKCSYEIFSA